jgi:hypothetical protein
MSRTAAFLALTAMNVSLAACAKQDEGNVCQDASEHVSSCFGTEPADLQTCDENVANDLLSKDCSQLIADGKADGNSFLCGFTLGLSGCEWKLRVTMLETNGQPAAGELVTFQQPHKQDVSFNLNNYGYIELTVPQLGDMTLVPGGTPGPFCPTVDSVINGVVERTFTITRDENGYPSFCR